MDVGDEETLARFGLPAEIEAGLLTGDIHTRRCAADLVTEHFVLTIERTSGQIVILHNTVRSLIVNEAPSINEALNMIGNERGAFVVDNGSVVRLETPEGGEPADPIGIVLQ